MIRKSFFYIFLYTSAIFSLQDQQMDIASKNLNNDSIDFSKSVINGSLYVSENITPINHEKDIDTLNLPAPYNSLKNVFPFDICTSYFKNHEQINKIFKYNKIHKIIEVGSLFGNSTIFFATLMRSGTIYSIDNWAGYAWCRSHIAYEQFLSNVIRTGFVHMIVPIRTDSIRGATFLSTKEESVDLVYVDAGHDASSVIQDLEAYYPFVANKHGILCGDDWGVESVAKGVISFAKKYDFTIYADDNFYFISQVSPFSIKSFVQASEQILHVVQ